MFASLASTLGISAGGPVRTEPDLTPASFNIERPPSAKEESARKRALQAAQRASGASGTTSGPRPPGPSGPVGGWDLKSEWANIKASWEQDKRQRLQSIETKRLAANPELLTKTLERIRKMSPEEVSAHLTVKDARSTVKTSDAAASFVVRGVGEILERTVGNNKGFVMKHLKQDQDLHAIISTEISGVPMLGSNALKAGLLAAKDVVAARAEMAGELQQGGAGDEKQGGLYDSNSTSALPDLAQSAQAAADPRRIPFVPDRLQALRAAHAPPIVPSYAQTTEQKGALIEVPPVAVTEVPWAASGSEAQAAAERRAPKRKHDERQNAAVQPLGAAAPDAKTSVPLHGGPSPKKRRESKTAEK